MILGPSLVVSPGGKGHPNNNTDRNNIRTPINFNGGLLPNLLYLNFVVDLFPPKQNYEVPLILGYLATDFHFKPRIPCQHPSFFVESVVLTFL